MRGERGASSLAGRTTSTSGLSVYRQEEPPQPLMVVMRWLMSTLAGHDFTCEVMFLPSSRMRQNQDSGKINCMRLEFQLGKLIIGGGASPFPDGPPHHYRIRRLDLGENSAF